MLISLRDYNPAKNLIGRPNVVNTMEPKDGKWQTNRALYEALLPLVNSKPTWQFRVSAHVTTGGDDSMPVATMFLIYEDDEKLGHVALKYKGQSYKIEVSNDRIEAKRKRGSGFNTEEPTKATLAIRKHFYRKGHEERALAAYTEAANLISIEKASKDSAKFRAHREMLAESTAFALKHLQQYLHEFSQMQVRHETYEKAKAESEVVSVIHNAFDNRNTLLVVLDGSQYIVKTKEGIKTFSDQELTYDMRRKIGLLKLVNDGQMVTDVGCRVDNTVFVLLPEAEGANDEN